MKTTEMTTEHLKTLAEDKNTSLIKLHKTDDQHQLIVENVGYIPEYALKAVIAKSFSDVYPLGKNGYRTHNLDVLKTKANLSTEFKREQKNNPRFKANWSTLSSWTTEFRYQTGIEKQTAIRFMNALNNKNGGVYPWIKRYW